MMGKSFRSSALAHDILKLIRAKAQLQTYQKDLVGIAALWVDDGNFKNAP